jgi:hypothetical protein
VPRRFEANRLARLEQTVEVRSGGRRRVQIDVEGEAAVDGGVGVGVGVPVGGVAVGVGEGVGDP